MNNLDDKLILKIFNYVDIYDLIKNCKIINKRFNNLIKKIQFNELILLNQATFHINNWFYNYNVINPRNVIPMKSNFLNSKFKQQFKKIKLLKIDYPIQGNQCLEILSAFKNLRHLEISFVKNLKKDIQLNLRQLEILLISHDVKLNFKFIVDSDYLKILKIDNLAFIVIKKPLTINHLELYKYHDNIHQFINLKKLKLSILNKSLNKIKLSILLELTELSCYASNLIENQNSNNFENIFNQEELNQTYFKELINLAKGKIILKDLLKKKRLNNRDNLKIYLKGVLINATNKLRKNLFSMFGKPDFILHKENSAKLEQKFNWFNEIDYIEFTNIYKTKINFKRYFNIQIVNLIGEIDNPNEFLNFISNCHNLSGLTLCFTSFNSEIYRRISLITKLITQLVIFEKDNIEIDYQFILKFKLLTNFYTNQQLNQDFVDKIIKNLKLINSFRYELNDDIILIKQNYLGEYSITKEKNILKKSLNNNLNDNLDEIKFLDYSNFDTEKKINLDSENSFTSNIEIINSNIGIKEVVGLNEIKFLDDTNTNNSNIDNEGINSNIYIKQVNLDINSIKQVDSEISSKIVNLGASTSNYNNSTDEDSLDEGSLNEDDSTNNDLKYDSANDGSVTESIDENLNTFIVNEEIDLKINLSNYLKEENQNNNDDKDIENDQKEDDKDKSKEENDNTQKEDLYPVIAI